MAKKSREQWGSKIGFILAAAGSTVGLGNIWRFSYVAGNEGGAAFVLIYLGVLFLWLSFIMHGDCNRSYHSKIQ